MHRFKFVLNSSTLHFIINQVKRLLELSILNAPFRFQDKMYKQIDEVVMGNPLAPIIADLWMQRMEQKLNKFNKNKPTI